MNEIKLQANAKINLTLDVLKKRHDGYHDLRMIMAEIPLYDIVSLRKAEQISVSGNFKFVPNNEKNTAYKAALEFFKETGISGGVSIQLEKRIPVSAGLAGGSTDAAAVLKGLNTLYNTRLSDKELAFIGDRVGKDVPFCVMGGVALAEGTGEQLTPLNRIPPCWIVLIKPKYINVSTREVFTTLDASRLELHPDTQGAIAALQQKDLNALCRRMYNVLEDVTVKKHPIISELKNVMLECGALGSVMSGSGPSVFGVFDSHTAALNAQKKLLEYDRQVFVLEIKDE